MHVRVVRDFVEQARWKISDISHAQLLDLFRNKLVAALPRLIRNCMYDVQKSGLPYVYQTIKHKSFKGDPSVSGSRHNCVNRSIPVPATLRAPANYLVAAFFVITVGLSHQCWQPLGTLGKFAICPFFGLDPWRRLPYFVLAVLILLARRMHVSRVAVTCVSQEL